jgi:hypothetical protein
MLSGETNRGLFAQHAETTDIAIVEGVMGLFDGAKNSGEGSTAAMAKHLRLPVLFRIPNQSLGIGSSSRDLSSHYELSSRERCDSQASKREEDGGLGILPASKRRAATSASVSRP